jgi:hypothetical protein
VLDAELGGATEPVSPQMVYVLYGQDLGPDVGMGDLQRAQQGMRAVVASALRYSLVRSSRDLSSLSSTARNVLLLVRTRLHPLVEPVHFRCKRQFTEIPGGKLSK